MAALLGQRGALARWGEVDWLEAGAKSLMLKLVELPKRQVNSLPTAPWEPQKGGWFP